MFRKNIKNLFIYHISKSISPTLTEFMANTKKLIIVFSTIQSKLESNAIYSDLVNYLSLKNDHYYNYLLIKRFLYGSVVTR